MKDGLASEDLKLTGSVLVSLGSVGTLQAGASEISSGEIGSSAVLTANIGSSAVDTEQIGSAVVDTANLATESVTFDRQKIIGTGSPTTYGLTELTGTHALSGGSRWVVFPTNFVTTPNVILSRTEVDQDPDAPEVYVGVGSADTGSFLAVGSTKNVGSFYWVAVGSGQV